MSTETAKETFNKKFHIKFRIIVISVTMLLVLFFQAIYIGINMRRLDSYAYKAEVEATQMYHEYLCQNFSTCMREIDILRSFIQRNGLAKYSARYLKLMPEEEANALIQETKELVCQISVSDYIIRDFLILGTNDNQRTLYCDVASRMIDGEKYPTVDLLGKTGLDGVLHTNLGYLTKCSDKQLNNTNVKGLNEEEMKRYTQMVEYIKGQYFICDYVADSLVVIRLNPQYFDEQFYMEGENKFIVYQQSGRPTLYFNVDEANATRLIQEQQGGNYTLEKEGFSYAHSDNWYGKLEVITEKENGNMYFSFSRNGFLYVAFAVVSILISVVCLWIFSNKVFRKINTLKSSIKKQIKSKHFQYMDLNDSQKDARKLNFSRRLLLTFVCSSLLSLSLVAIVFHLLVELESREIAENLGKQLSQNYANECMISYERYNSLSMEEIEQFLAEYKQDDQYGNTELIRGFEEKFYYETTLLPRYLYAFITNQQDEILYQTVFSNQSQVSDELIRKILTDETLNNRTMDEGVFVPTNDLMSGEKVLAFVKDIYLNEEKRGSMILVSNAPELKENGIERAVLNDALIVDHEEKVLVGEAEVYQSQYLKSGNQFDATNKIIYSVDARTEDYLGKCVVLTYYNFYVNQIRAMQYENLMWMLVIMVVCLVATLVLKRLFVVPFNTLIANMNATPTSGYHKIKEDYVIDEIDAIAVAYNKMMARIEELVEEDIRKETERKELEVLQAQTEFRMLEQQMNPHFLFNTLECVNLLAIRSGEKSISSIVKSLSMILRYSLSKEVVVTVKREIQVLTAYIEIQKFRFGDNFNIELDLDETLYEVQMIKFVLQPIVENAILHGMQTAKGDGEIKISLKCYEDGIEFCVCDNGSGMSETTLETLRKKLVGEVDEDTQKKVGGIGLRNVYRRIELYYQGRGKVLVHSTEGEGTKVIVRLPFEPEEY